MQMISEEKIKAARKKLKRGTPQGELLEQLKADGYTEQDITKVFAPHKYDMRSWYLCSAILLLLAGLGVMLAQKGFLLLIFSAAMFFAYAREVERLKKAGTGDDNA